MGSVINIVCLVSHRSIPELDMASTDLDLLLSMGFEKTRAEIAVSKTGGCKSLVKNGLETF